MPETVQLVHEGAGKGGPFGIWQAVVAGHVNVYLVKPERGASALVDAGPVRGPGGEPSTEKIRALLAVAKVKPEQVDRIVLTHAHPNHAGGLAAARDLLPRAELCTSPFDAQYLRQPAKQVDEDIKRLKVLFRRWGAPADSRELVAAALDSYRARRVWDGPEVETKRELRAGDEVVLGGAVFEVIEAPGHHAGALLFYHSEGGELFTGDNVAMEPVPMPMLSTGRDGVRIVSGPSLVDGLERLKDLMPKIVFPGHGAVLTEPENVLDEEIHFYRGRAQRLMAQLIDDKMSVWEIAAESDPKRLMDRISLVFCFLDLLLRESAIDCKLEKGVDRYHVPL